MLRQLHFDPKASRIILNEWMLESHHLKEYAASVPDIVHSSDSLAFRDIWITANISDFHSKIFSEEDILQYQLTMQDIISVQVLDA